MGEAAKTDDVSKVHRSALAKCLPLKEKYDQCFNGWYRFKFLQNQSGGTNCDDFFDEYRACLIEEVERQGLGHLNLFGPSKPTDL